MKSHRYFPHSLLLVGALFALLCCESVKTVGYYNAEFSTDIHGDTATEIEEDSAADTHSEVDSAPQTCNGMPLSPGDSTRTVMVGETQRSYLLHIPNSYTGEKAVPFIFDFHRIGWSGEATRAISPYPAVTDPEGVIMVFPDGLPGPFGAAWNIGPCCVDDVDDVAFVRKIVDDVASVACIDQSRIYAVGTSMGGGFSHYLGCEAADIFAAIAPAAFDLIEENVPGCTPAFPITVLTSRGTEDFLVPYEGGYSDGIPDHPVTFLGALETLYTWAEINGCTGQATDMGNFCLRYGGSQCRDGVEVILCTLVGVDIAPGDASFIWPILKEHTR